MKFFSAFNHGLEPGITLEMTHDTSTNLRYVEIQGKKFLVSNDLLRNGDAAVVLDRSGSDLTSAGYWLTIFSASIDQAGDKTRLIASVDDSKTALVLLTGLQNIVDVEVPSAMYSPWKGAVKISTGQSLKITFHDGGVFKKKPVKDSEITFAEGKLLFQENTPHLLHQ